MVSVLVITYQLPYISFTDNIKKKQKNFDTQMKTSSLTISSQKLNSKSTKIALCKIRSLSKVKCSTENK